MNNNLSNTEPRQSQIRRGLNIWEPTEGWCGPVAKDDPPNLCVLLVVRGKLVGGDLPDGVDAVVPDDDAQALTTTLKQMLKKFSLQQWIAGRDRPALSPTAANFLIPCPPFPVSCNLLVCKVIATVADAP
ncbi:MAG TPA: hypothetical protein VN223_11650 [Candidatus Elarobacter sp.]|nr:hypothetical protein [Candidatus Elarobacter sp.]